MLMLLHGLRPLLDLCYTLKAPGQVEQQLKLHHAPPLHLDELQVSLANC